MRSNPKHVSPLRYPGGKTKLSPMITELIEQVWGGTVPPVFVEPFAGGAGLGLKLLSQGVISRLHLNDLDRGVYAFWKSCIQDTSALCEQIINASVTVEEWHKQHHIYMNPNNGYSALELGFATFFLNRTNRSGILTGRPIGGLDQSGKYKIDCRWNTTNLIERIRKVSDMGDYIEVTNDDANNIIGRYHNREDTLLFLDPPYVVQGKTLYKNSFTIEDHTKLSGSLIASDTSWVLTYDTDSLISDKLYKELGKTQFTLPYSVNTKKRGEELMIYSHNLKPYFERTL